MDVSKKIYKVVILGEAGVGKSSLIRRYTQGYFSARTTTTVGVDRIPITVEMSSEKVHMQILDTSGCYGFRGLIQSYMANIDAVVFMFDLSNKETFASLPLWNGILRKSGKSDVVKVLVGNKRDLASQRQVLFKNAKNYAEFEDMVAMEISVKEAESVELVFQSVAREIQIKEQQKKQEIEAMEIRKKRLLKNSSSEFMSGGSDFIDDESQDPAPKMFARRLSLMLGRRKANVRKENAPLLNTRTPPTRSKSPTERTLKQFHSTTML